MTKIKHIVGGSPGVIFNLPTTKIGETSIMEGKVLIDIYGLKCSESLSFSKGNLLNLSQGANKLYKTLKGNIKIQSECNTFEFLASAGTTGNIKIEVKMKRYQFSQPNNAEWKASGSFYCNPECLLPLIEIQNEI